MVDLHQELYRLCKHDLVEIPVYGVNLAICVTDTFTTVTVEYVVKMLR